MLPITRATLQSFCRVCIKELPKNVEHTREPNHDINKNELYEMFQSISGIIMKSSELNLYPQSVCHGCFVKANAFLKFRDKAIIATGVLRLLINEGLRESSLTKLQSYCRICFKKRNHPNDKCYSTEKNGEVYNYMCECTGLYVAGETLSVDILKDDKRFPTHLCGKCYAILKNFVEFRGVSKQTEDYLQGLLDNISNHKEISEDKKDVNPEKQVLKKQSFPACVVLEQLAICDIIKSEIPNNEVGISGPDVDFNFEMPIEVQIDSEMQDCEGIDLDAVDIKKELNDDEEKEIAFLKLENIESTLGDNDIANQIMTRCKTRRSQKLKDEFEDWDSHSTESSDDSDFDFEKKPKKKTKNKKRTSKTSNITKNLITNIQSIPRTRRSIKTDVSQKNESQYDEDKMNDEFSLSVSSANCTNDAMDNDDEKNDDIENLEKLVKKPKTLRTTFSCSECNKSFYKQYMYEAHIRGVHEGVEKPFSCQYCDSTFRLVQLLNRHVNVRHLSELMPIIADDDPLNSTAQNIFICGFCQRPFRRNDHLKEHIRAVHEGLRPFKCDKCGKSFGSRNTLSRHEKNHSGARPFKCEFCAKGYNSETELKVHLQRHTTNPELLCHICKRGKSSVEELKKHLAMHESSRQHQCTKCGKIFTKLFHLREHDSAVHLKLRPFKCNRCDQTFGIRKTLKTHERRHDPTDRPEFCASCDLYFKTKRALLMHMKKAHPSEKQDANEKQDTTLSDPLESH